MSKNQWSPSQHSVRSRMPKLNNDEKLHSYLTWVWNTVGYKSNEPVWAYTDAIVELFGKAAVAKAVKKIPAEALE